MQSAVRLFPDESPPQNSNDHTAHRRKYFAFFFEKSSYVATISLEDRRTVTSDLYVHHCHPKVVEVWSQRRPETELCGLFPLHDHASAHAAATSVVFLKEIEMQLLPHPPYLSDLSPCDFFLFPEMKKQLKGYPV